MSDKLFVLGLDCAEPSLVFEKFRNELPNISNLFPSNAKSFMKSTIPPITIPAWLSMATGKDPGEMGLYGFRHRKTGSYDTKWIANATYAPAQTIFNIASKKGKNVITMGFPPSYPLKPIHGSSIGCFLTPGSEKSYTYPDLLKQEIENLVGDYIFDVVFRTSEREKTLKKLYEMVDKHFKVLEYMIMNKRWDLFWFVEIGIDRIHHTFWKYMDKDHHLYTPGNPFENAILDYYKYIDEKVGKIVNLLDKAGASIIIVSDHGAKRMKGNFVLNQWLMEEGYLVLKNKPENRIISIEDADVDWNKTTAWGWGGYYGRIFLNVEGREPSGIVKKKDYDNVIEELKCDLMSIKDDHGNPLKNIVETPENLYKEVNGDPPDLMVILDDLYWRCAGTVGHSTNYLMENDTGPDDAVHAQYGIFGLKDVENRYSFKNVVDITEIFGIEKNLLKL
ncbi:MAG: alkaline phosphatase family protein [Candidatus Thermoplasmatota archaeon]|jgi:predicted AlkP superfamily phosphohydrolase/phosphomutase|nr:alkaline phosphatase family protein [Candidatus Thermoplasmatota archaeon]MCL5963210.1 alkaline phosphatase family protein [Candidatus Thermoplasmatota archaeon]